MMHNHLLSFSDRPIAGTSGLQTAAALSETALLNQSLNQPKEELKTHFQTREGVYRVMTQAEYSRPNRTTMLSQPSQANAGGPNATGSGAPVRVSFVTLNPTSPVQRTDDRSDDVQGNSLSSDDLSCADRICFNVGRELYVYNYRGTQTSADLTKPVDKRIYKGTFPTCHSFNQETASSSTCSLLVGFSAGQIQLIDPSNKEYQLSRLYNEERFIDKSAVTCLKWVPGQPQHFLVSYTSGYMYLYNEELQCPQLTPTYQIFKQGNKYTVYTCKAKTTRNPIYRWQIGDGCINQFAFSGPDAKMLATVGHDGYLRIFNYHQMELLAVMKSYFGGLLTLGWSPDAKLIVTGGEDDLLTVYHVQEKRVLCRGQGHKSWISQVAFDPYTSSIFDGDGDLNGGVGALDVGSDDETQQPNNRPSPSTANGPSAMINVSTSSNVTTPVLRANMRRPPLHASSMSRSSFASFGTINGVQSSGMCYRIGSVGHDTQLCLWDITEEMLRPANVQRHRNSTIIAPMAGLEIQTCTSRLDPLSEASPAASSTTNEKPRKKRVFSRGFTLGRLGASNSDRRKVDNPSAAAAAAAIDEARLLGTRICPRMEDVPVIEPLICKKIAHERLTVLEFRRDCIVTACQEGFICTWARPGVGKGPINMKKDLNTPSTMSPPSVIDNRNAAFWTQAQA